MSGVVFLLLVLPLFLLILCSTLLVSLGCLPHSLWLHHRPQFPPLQRFIVVLFLNSSFPQVTGSRVGLRVGSVSKFMLGAQPLLC